MKKKQNNNLETILKKNVNKWLITGVAGFIGSNILEQLLMSDQKVVGIDNLSTGSLKNLSSVEKSVGKKKWKNFSFIKGDLADLKICNKIIKNVDRNANDNVQIVNETNIVARQSEKIASNIVEDATSKKFSGKEEIKVRKNLEDPHYKGVNRREKID